MTDKTQFEPYKKEKEVEVTIFRREAILLQKLRKFSFGKFTVHKMNGIIIRVEPQSSELIEEDEDITLE